MTGAKAVQPLKFGLVATCQTPPGTSLSAYADSEIRLVHMARDAGWASIWVVHHYLPTVMSMPQPAPWLGRLITETGDLQLGVGILVLPLLNPVDVAETYGSIDALSNGRLVLGVGLGYRAEEFDAFGLDVSDRVHRFIGNLAALRQLWNSSDGTAEIDLEWSQVSGTGIGARPTQRPGPPLLIGANKERAIQRAARLGDGWLISPFSRRERVLSQISVFRDARREAGLPPVGEMTLGREVYCAATRSRAVEIAKNYLGDKYSAYAQWRGSSSREHVDEFEEFARDRFIIGDPDDCVAALVPYLDADVNHIKFRTRWLGMTEAEAQASVALLTREVTPALQDLWASRGRL